VFDAILSYLDAGWLVAIHSSRSHALGGVETMQLWFRHHGFPNARMHQLEFPEHKPPAKLYVDDRGYCFTGQLPTVEWADAFKPWNK
jgi:hypothetical protein